jgi:hypothetical protein
MLKNYIVSQDENMEEEEEEIEEVFIAFFVLVCTMTEICIHSSSIISLSWKLRNGLILVLINGHIGTDKWTLWY